MRSLLAVSTLMCGFGMQATAATAPTTSMPSVHLLCASRGGHLHEGCLLVNSLGERLSPHTFATHDDAPSDGMLRTFANITKAAGGYDWRYGFVNVQGHVVVPPTYKEANAYSGGLARVATAQGWAYLDTQGRVALQLGPEWAEAQDFHHGLALALARGRGYMTGTHPMSSVGPRRVAPPWSVIDKTGRIVMGYEPSKDTSPAVGYTTLDWYSRYGFTAPAIDVLGGFIGGRAVFKRSVPRGDKLVDELGMIDTQGRIVIEPSKKHWDQDSLRKLYPPAAVSHKPSAALRKHLYVVDNFHEGLAWAIDAWQDKKREMHYRSQGFVNLQGNWVFKVDPQTDPVRPFDQGHAVVRINEHRINEGQTEVLIDRKGRVVANYRSLVAGTAR